MRCFASLYPEDVRGLVLVDSLSANLDSFIRFVEVVPPEHRDAAVAFETGQNEEGVDLEGSRAQVRQLPSLPDVPLVVLTAADTPAPAWWPAATAVTTRIGVQAEVARLVPRGRQIVVPQSKHFIQRDQPAVVIDAVLSVVDEVRRALRLDNRPRKS